MMVFIVFILQSTIALFGEGIFSTEKVDYGIAINQDENLGYVVRHEGNWGSGNNPPSKIHRYIKKDDIWISTGYAEFSDKNTDYSDSDMFISYDGKTAFFVSTRPYEGKPGESDPDIFMMEWKGEEWTEPVPVTAVNSNGYEASPVTDGKGNLYFTSIREGGPGLGDIYTSRLLNNGKFDNPSLLKGAVNTSSGEWNLIVSFKADWIIFESSGRVEGMSSFGDLYISRKDNKGVWKEVRNLQIINSTGSDLNPRILYESNRLIWASSKKLENKDVNFYSTDLDKLGL